MIRNPPTPLLVLLLSAFQLRSAPFSCRAFVVPSTNFAALRSCSVEPRSTVFGSTRLYSSTNDPDADDDSATDEDGADLASAFFQMAQSRGVSIDESDLLDDDYDDDDDFDDDDEDYKPAYTAEEYLGYDPNEGAEAGDDDEDDDDEDEYNYPKGAVDAFTGFDPDGADANPKTDISSDQLNRELAERVLDTAGGFVEMTRGIDDNEDIEESLVGGPKRGIGDGYDDNAPYVPPTTVPDPELTAGEVVLLVLKALKNNDTPSTNRGVEILFGYSSDFSQIKQEVSSTGLTTAEYRDFLRDTGYDAVFDHESARIDKGEYSTDGYKAYYTANLKTGPGFRDYVPVKFMLSSIKTSVPSEDEPVLVWLVDSMNIRPQSVRRSWRRR